MLNLLRGQDPPPADLADRLIEIVRRRIHGATQTDYAIQHLGALQHDVRDERLRRRIRRLFLEVAERTDRPFAGTALYALADAGGLSADEESALRRLTLAACRPEANPIARLSAIQLAGQRGYGGALPAVRAVLDGAKRDAVTDIASVGTVGLLGDASDLPRLDALSARGGSRLREPTAVARERIRERMR